MKAHKIGLPTFEASVSCGAYCQGGSVNMQPTTYPEFTDADEVWVKGEDAAKLAAENATLRSRLAEAEFALAILKKEREWAQPNCCAAWECDRANAAEARLADWHRVADERSAEIVRLSTRLAETERLLQEVYDGRQSLMSVGLVYRIGHTLNHRPADSATHRENERE